MSPALVGMGQGMAKGEAVQGVLPAVARPRSVLPSSLMGTWALTPMQTRAAVLSSVLPQTCQPCA